jgi:alkanesulfonate monooxygenase SsuD/methylene tetrahydromethanopterin reductase-like flavin-dependent oxidoreductase (luciferase family)
MADRMKYGFQVLTYGAPWADSLDAAKRLDDLGYDYLFGHDHLYSTGGNPYQPFFEGWTTLAAWAQATKRIRLGLTVGNNTFRNPGVVAKMAATIDHVSGGRSIFGLGAGNVELEAVAHGLPWGSAGVRLDWLEEALKIVTGLFDGQTVTNHGPTYQFDAVRHAPVPMQPHLPVLIGAEGEKKGLRLAAQYADIWQIFMGIDDHDAWHHKDEVLRAHCVDVGRDERHVERMVGCKMIIRRDPAEAHRVFEQLRQVHKWNDDIWTVVWAASPEQVAESLVRYRALGVQAFCPQLGWPYDRETVELLIGEVAPLVERATA